MSDEDNTNNKPGVKTVTEADTPTSANTDKANPKLTAASNSSTLTSKSPEKKPDNNLDADAQPFAPVSYKIIELFEQSLGNTQPGGLFGRQASVTSYLQNLNQQKYIKFRKFEFDYMKQLAKEFKAAQEGSKDKLEKLAELEKQLTLHKGELSTLTNSPANILAKAANKANAVKTAGKETFGITASKNKEKYEIEKQIEAKQQEIAEIDAELYKTRQLLTSPRIKLVKEIFASGQLPLEQSWTDGELTRESLRKSNFQYNMDAREQYIIDFFNLFNDSNMVVTPNGINITDNDGKIRISGTSNKAGGTTYKFEEQPPNDKDLRQVVFLHKQNMERCLNSNSIRSYTTEWEETLELKISGYKQNPEIALKLYCLSLKNGQIPKITDPELLQAIASNTDLNARYQKLEEFNTMVNTRPYNEENRKKLAALVPGKMNEWKQNKKKKGYIKQWDKWRQEELNGFNLTVLEKAELEAGQTKEPATPAAATPAAATPAAAAEEKGVKADENVPAFNIATTPKATPTLGS